MNKIKANLAADKDGVYLKLSVDKNTRFFPFCSLRSGMGLEKLRHLASQPTRWKTKVILFSIQSLALSDPKSRLHVFNMGS